ncbi:Ypt/Rab-GAP domain of gyp1p superfamily protein isoform 5 [Hibiscus syriacus]|uniref:Ypt/Rab-GAP domain of gyp1p superfamily protein isoform 5 n=1 Tax=Hibiscus syriacus TaxID=106335 RepID=A0A6A2Z1R2_HIBSY|nr:Ypt/Rab-GAP domain of gyp1p superfamily protein isoform 5 [Hibiscus syriacus]
MMFYKAAGTEELDAFYPIRKECVANVPKTRFRPRAGKTLSARRWHAAFSADGHLDMEKVIRRIQRGGIHPSIKGVVWEFLLGCFDPESSFDDRNQLRQERRERYETWKTECQNIVPVIGSGKFITTPIITDNGQPIEVEDEPMINSVPDKKAAQWMYFLHQIGLDVVRTDRALAFYERETNQANFGIFSLYIHGWNDIGYVQGMNDICSPMVILFDNEQMHFGVLSVQCEGWSIPYRGRFMKTLVFMLVYIRECVKRLFDFLSTSAHPKPGEKDKEDAPSAFHSLNARPKLHGHRIGARWWGVLFAFRMLMGTFPKRVLLRRFHCIFGGLTSIPQIMGDIVGNLDAKKACENALKIQNKYMKKTKNDSCRSSKISKI